ncbi:hypothetical protein TIFTF001_038710 [Ficus carica]|uniref:Uncharacterized protein n=1 Tax=Ficus carica TaxID=3494 RepID=A0AA88E7S9_FICCA|nr:hypothetical protein TIFTF001_038710 [Ficus carica]
MRKGQINTSPDFTAPHTERLDPSRFRGDDGCSSSYDSSGSGFSIQRGGEPSLLAVEKMEACSDRKCQGRPEKEEKERNSDGQRRRREEEEAIGEIGRRGGRNDRRNRPERGEE